MEGAVEQFYGQDLPPKADVRRKLFGNSIAITVLTVCNLGLSFGLQVLLANFFGARAEMDAYLASTTLPMFINTVLLGVMNFTLVPLLVELQNTADGSMVWRTISHLANAAGVLLLALVVCGAIAAVPLIAATNPGFDSNKLALTVELFKLTLPTIFFVGAAYLLASVSYAHERFLLASIAPVANAALELLVVVVLNRQLGIYAAAYGLLAGAIVQCALMVTVLLPRGRYAFVLDWQNPINRRVLALALPLLIGSIFYKATGVSERFFASTVGEGSISYLGYAFKIAAALQLVITQGIAVSFLPLMSRAAARHDVPALRATVSLGLRSLLVVTIPIIGLVIALGGPSVHLLLQRGAFGQTAAEATSYALLAYMGWVLTGSLGAVLTNAFYARQETSTVVRVGVGGMVTYLIAAFVLTHLWGFVGTAFALSLSTTLNALIFIVLLRQRLHGLDEVHLLITAVKSISAGAVMTLIIAFASQLSTNWLIFPVSSDLNLLSRAVALALGGIGIYVLLGWLLNLRELTQITLYLRAIPSRS